MIDGNELLCNPSRCVGIEKDFVEGNDDDDTTCDIWFEVGPKCRIDIVVSLRMHQYVRLIRQGGAHVLVDIYFRHPMKDMVFYPSGNAQIKPA